MASFPDSHLHALAERELAAFHAARERGDVAAGWRSLERAHIISQPYFGLHGRVHFQMCRYALEQRLVAEVVGQLFRLLLVPLGHMLGRLPLGNTGRANVSAFAALPVPNDLAEVLGVQVTNGLNKEPQ